MSSKIDALEPNGEPLAVLLASIVARLSSPDFIPPHAIGSDTVGGDIARHAARAIAGIPLGITQTGNRIDVTGVLRLFAAAGIGAGVRLLQRAGRVIAAALPVFRNIGDNTLHRLRESVAPRLPARLNALAENFRTKAGVGLALAALGLALIVLFASDRINRPASPSVDGAPLQGQESGAVQLAEDRPLRDPTQEFTRANLRYCTFQQIRLEALGPITEGADLVVFNALVEDWNGRCTKHRYRAEDKEAVDAEAGRRRVLLQVEGRALVNVWRRKIVTTVQQRPTPASLDPGDVTATTLAAPEQLNDAMEQLPLLITLGRATADESARGFSLKSPSLALVRGDVAMRVQRRLNELGYTTPVDGTWGSASRAALGRFKKANGLLRNDAFDAETVTRLFSTSAVTAAADPHKDETTIVETVYPPPPPADLNPLNRADGQRIQQRLGDLGYYSGVREGVWDSASRAALRTFKTANGLGNTEEWDAPTEAVLLDEQAVRADAVPSDVRKSVPPAAVPLPPKRPPPPAKASEPAAATAPRGAARPPGAVPAPPRVSGAATR